MTRAIMWFRRDLRLADNPALLDAVAAGTDGVLALFVVDDELWARSGPPRRAYLVASLADLAERIPLQVVRGKPAEEVVRVARAVGACTVHAAADFGPYGSRRDRRVDEALCADGRAFIRSGSPYAVAPGRVRKKDGTPYRVFTPFARAWAAHGWPGPVSSPRSVPWIETSHTVPLPEPHLPTGLALPSAGEAAARRRWRNYVDHDLADYAQVRDLPGIDRTSRMSVHLKWGELHPRTLLSTVAQHRGAGPDVYRRELAFREFYADVLWHHPGSARDYYNEAFAVMDYADPSGEPFTAWRDGRTGFPIVDAGMRQLRAEGWMHNRVRMIAASFLVKDLHIEWQNGARHFMRWLVDGDLASNQHGWQWVAGCGTDAAPYFRVFNPVTQGRTFDPDGEYIRRFVPELSGLDRTQIHEPWRLPDGPPSGYPAPIVDHAEERTESLARFQATR